MIIKGVKLRSEVARYARSAAKNVEQISVRTSDLKEYVQNGWALSYEGKTRSRVNRPKELPKLIADRIWIMLYRMGFSMLSEETGAFLCKSGNDREEIIPIGCLASDDETVVLVQCETATEIRSSNDLLLSIDTLASNRLSVGQAFREDDPSIKRKVGTILAIWNYEPTEADIDRARQNRVVLLDCSGLDYYERLIEHTGEAARFQLLGELFAGQTIEGLRSVVPAVEARIGSRVAYTFAIPADYLLKISYIAHRARGEFGVLHAYQRMVKRSRLEAIRQYISSGGVFPSNIVVNFTSARRGEQIIRFEAAHQHSNTLTDHVKIGWLHLPARYQSAWIIDGQHRLLAYSGHDRADTSFLTVTAFVGLDASDQADMFVRINSEQKKVSGNLLVELYATLHWNSTDIDDQIYSIVSRAIQDLNARSSSPLHDRIKLENDPPSLTKCITLKSIATELRKPGFYIARKQFGKAVEYGPLWAAVPDKTLRRTKYILDSWFAGVRCEATEIWDQGKQPGGYLAMNDGVVVSLMVLRSVFEHIEETGDVAMRLTDSELAQRIEPFARLFGKYFHSMKPSELEDTRRRRGVEGQTETFRRVQSYIHDHIPIFCPLGLEDWQAKRADNKMAEAYSLVANIEHCLQALTVQTLQDNFGDERDIWWSQVPRDVRVEAAKRREDDDRSRGEEEKYLNLIDYRKIYQAHWQDIFEPIVGYGSGNKDKRTDWLVKTNNIRNKVMHASAGGLKIDEFNFLVEIDAWLRSKEIEVN